ncbi:unnamed protein product [Arctia plantaginis]|uniref:Uncharacterized protein n=1 Tax=Arctia plantaginis TaxID=874455 RepID=A0A8S0YZ04_ARCPL|nr:unnamed protein product [Arctia plantaginis]
MRYLSQLITSHNTIIKKKYEKARRSVTAPQNVTQSTPVPLSVIVNEMPAKLLKAFLDLYPDVPPFNWFYHGITKFYYLTTTTTTTTTTKAPPATKR